MTLVPINKFNSFIRSCSGVNSLRTNTCAAFTASPNPPELSGIIPIICGGTRCALSRSPRLAFLMLKKSSFVATSLSGRILIPSGLPFGAYMNRLRKLPSPFVSRIACRIRSTSLLLCAASVIYRM